MFAMSINLPIIQMMWLYSQQAIQFKFIQLQVYKVLKPKKLQLKWDKWQS